MPASTISQSRPGADEELGDPLQRALGGREPDPLHGGVRAAPVLVVSHEVFESLQGQRHVGAALGLGDGVDLVDDHGLDPGQDLLSPASSSSDTATPGVVIRMSGGLRSIACRSRCGVSPVRRPIEIGAPIPFSGARRLRSTS